MTLKAAPMSVSRSRAGPCSMRTPVSSIVRHDVTMAAANTSATKVPANADGRNRTDIRASPTVLTRTPDSMTTDDHPIRR